MNPRGDASGVATPETTASTGLGQTDETPSPTSHTPTTPAAADHILTGLLKVASIFAPLVGQEAKPVEDTPGSGARLAALMGAIGILLAVLQLIVGAFDLISRPAALLGKYLPYVIVVLLVGGAFLSLRVLLRTPSQRRRRQAGALLVTIVLVGLTWGGFTLYNQLRPPHGFLVLVADFDGANATRKGDFAGRIGAELTRELVTLGDTVSVERTLETYADAQAAQSAGAAARPAWSSGALTTILASRRTSSCCANRPSPRRPGCPNSYAQPCGDCRSRL
ncbi:MAG: hypothetical protein HZY76_13875 [Anaerolineae bacterium]|nr:MAG: hypothetical protein HZY76_13875 [Anaerolineae bacterium]